MFYILVETHVKTIPSQADFNGSMWYLSRAGWDVGVGEGFSMCYLTRKDSNDYYFYVVLLLLNQVS